MSKYNNYKVWKKVDDVENQVYLQDHKKYSIEELTEIFLTLLKKAEESGLEGCYIRFESTMEPYEDFLGNPVVMASGYRGYTEEEIKDQKREETVAKIAEEKGILYYQARNYLELKEKGVI